MIIETIVTISHEEMHDLHLTDKDFKELGYVLKETNQQGKVFSKTSWQTPCKGENRLFDTIL